MIENRYFAQIGRRVRAIRESRFGPEDAKMLEACVHAMAQEFPDLRFADIPTVQSPRLLELFCSIARHHYSVASLPIGIVKQSSTIIHHAIYCPISDAAIIGIVMAYEREYEPIWKPTHQPSLPARMRELAKTIATNRPASF